MKNGRFTFRALPDTKLAVIYVADVLRAFGDLLAAPAAGLSQQVYNIHATVTPREIAGAILRRLPDTALRFEPDPAVAALLASWPGVIDDSVARHDWGWRPSFDLEQMTEDFLRLLQSDSALTAK